MSAPLRPRPAGPSAAEARPPSRGLGRSSSPAAERVSDALRRLDSPELTARRRVTALSLAASAALGVVHLYQTGLIRRPPELRLPGLDAERVDASGEAYDLFRTPDAGLGLTSYGVTLVLVAMGAEDRATTAPWIPLLAAAKVVGDAGNSVWLFLEQVTKHRAVCGWCTLAGVANLAAVPLVLPEARRAWRALRRR